MLYRSLTRLAGAAVRPAAAFDPALRERMALDDLPALPGGIWVHAASVGELNSARLIVAGLAAARPVLVTANSRTGRAVARGWGLAARLAPLDSPQAVTRFLDALRPALAVTVENEIWPNRSAALRARGIGQAVIGARMSARSARRWDRARGLIAPVLGGIDLLSAQDAATEARLIGLGLRAGALAPRTNLKLMRPASIVPPPDRPDRGTVWLAASTHPGEEETVLDAHLALRRRHPGARLVLAPRHPRRADAVAAMIAARGLTMARLSHGESRGQGEGPSGGAAVLLIDRLGAMENAYAAAGICMVGGSLTDRGGHTPWEPAAFRCALLHGPHVANFADDYAALDAAGAAVQVSADRLAGQVGALMDAPPRRLAMGRAARAALMAAAPDPDGLVATLLSLAADGLLEQAAGGPDIGGPKGDAG